MNKTNKKSNTKKVDWSAAGRKAWETRREKARRAKASEAAKKAWVTRHANGE